MARLKRINVKSPIRFIRVNLLAESKFLALSNATSTLTMRAEERKRRHHWVTRISFQPSRINAGRLEIIATCSGVRS